ncbi:MAG: hypothetical protein F6K56_35560 [Moorea sp. SIO3G5]|nr:hypothetical protein [Moorena sp. SIO3G5]
MSRVWEVWGDGEMGRWGDGGVWEVWEVWGDGGVWEVWEVWGDGEMGS